MSRILLVDDDPETTQSFSRILEGAGYEVESCHDGGLVLPRLEQGGVDLLILDMLLPNVDGFALLSALGRHPTLSALPIIVISGIYRQCNHASVLEGDFGVHHFFDKPVDVEDLLGALREIFTGLNSGEHSSTPPSAQELPVDLNAMANISSIPLAGDDPVEAEDGVMAMAMGAMARVGAEPWPADKIVDPDAERERREVERISRERMRTEIAQRIGSIAQKPVPSILGELWQARATGALLLRRAKLKKIIYLSEGTPYRVKSNLVAECLGRMLVREGSLSSVDCLSAIDRMKETGERQGQVLIAMGKLDEKSLEAALVRQFQEKFFDTFEWDEGQYRFSEQVSPAERTMSNAMDGAQTILEGIVRKLRGDDLSRRLEPLGEKSLRLIPAKVAELSLAPTQRQALDAFRLPATVADFLNGTDLPPVEALQLVYGCWVVGCFEVGPA